MQRFSFRTFLKMGKRIMLILLYTLFTLILIFIMVLWVYSPGKPKPFLDANGKLGPVGFKRENWKDAGPIRKVFKDAFTSAGLPCFKPHSIRDTITQLGQKICKTPEDFKAWSQNLGHDDVLTTFTSYGAVASKRQAEIIRNLGTAKNDGQDQSAIAAMESLLAQMKAQGKDCCADKDKAAKGDSADPHAGHNMEMPKP